MIGKEIHWEKKQCCFVWKRCYVAFFVCLVFLSVSIFSDWKTNTEKSDCGFFCRGSIFRFCGGWSRPLFSLTFLPLCSLPSPTMSEECCVCFGEATETVPLKFCSCGKHLVHSKCLEEWASLSLKGMCPLRCDICEDKKSGVIMLCPCKRHVVHTECYLVMTKPKKSDQDQIVIATAPISEKCAITSAQSVQCAICFRYGLQRGEIPLACKCHKIHGENATVHYFHPWCEGRISGILRLRKKRGKKYIPLCLLDPKFVCKAADDQTDWRCPFCRRSIPADDVTDHFKEFHKVETCLYCGLEVFKHSMQRHLDFFCSSIRCASCLMPCLNLKSLAMKCRHRMHEECRDAWLPISNYCPLCCGGKMKTVDVQCPLPNCPHPQPPLAWEHLVNHHRPVLCRVCDTVVIKTNKSLHDEKICPFIQISCPASGCGHKFVGRCIDILKMKKGELPLKWLIGDHRCRALYQCSFCGDVFRESEEMAEHQALSCRGIASASVGMRQRHSRNAKMNAMTKLSRTGKEDAKFEEFLNQCDEDEEKRRMRSRKRKRMVIDLE